MVGTVIGDLSGSENEYLEFVRLIKGSNDKPNIQINQIITKESFFSDDTILTMSVLDCILNNGSYGEYLKVYYDLFKGYKPNTKIYFEKPFSPDYINWVNGLKEGNSTGSGAMMRISPVGYLFDNEEDVIEQAYLATSPSHNSKEAIECATIVALIIFYARLGLEKNQIYKIINRKISIQLKPFQKFNTTCYETLPNCLYILFQANNFEEAIRKVIRLGGDTDTNAAIVGSMAEAMYGIPDYLISRVYDKLPFEFNQILEKGYDKVKTLYR